MRLSCITRALVGASGVGAPDAYDEVGVFSKREAAVLRACLPQRSVGLAEASVLVVCGAVACSVLLGDDVARDDEDADTFDDNIGQYALLSALPAATVSKWLPHNAFRLPLPVGVVPASGASFRTARTAQDLANAITTRATLALLADDRMRAAALQNMAAFDGAVAQARKLVLEHMPDDVKRCGPLGGPNRFKPQSLAAHRAAAPSRAEPLARYQHLYRLRTQERAVSSSNLVQLLEACSQDEH